MANEFKVKKGLIVDGTNTVLDIQGTQGQLFSVTDSLTGDLFSVSDISGVPIFNVNSSGLSTFDGDMKVDGGEVEITSSDSDTILTIANTKSGGQTWKIHSASSSSLPAISAGDFLIRNGSTNVLRLGGNNNYQASFAGRISTTRTPGANHGDPTISFGDGNTGFYERSDNDLRVSIGGSGLWEFSSNCLGSISEGKAHFNNETATATNPSIIPWRNDADTGIGRGSANVLSLIAGGVEALSLSTTSATFAGNVTVDGKLRIPVAWDSGTLENNAIYAKNSTDGFGMGNGTGISTWWAWSTENGLMRMIDCANSGEYITLRTSNTDRVTINSTGATFAGAINCTGVVTSQQRKTFSTSISNSYVTVLQVSTNTSQLASIVKLSATAHGGSHVGAWTADILVNHSQDINVKSQSGNYTLGTIKIQSNGNGEYHVLYKSNSSNAATYYFQAEALTHTCSLTPNPTSTPSTTSIHEHVLNFGTNFTQFDNSSTTNGKASFGCEVEATSLDINGTADISSSLNVGGQITGTSGYNEFGNATSSVSNDGSWNARLNVAGSSHARLDVKSVSDGIITTMYAHTGHAAGKVGTMSNHPIALMTGGTTRGTVGTSGSLTMTGAITGTQYNLTGNVSNPTSTAVAIYDQASVGLTLSAHNVSIRNYNGSAMMESARFIHNKLTVAGDVIAYGSPSDKRLKENIKPIDSALDKVMKLQGITFDWKKSDSILDIKEDIGFIAQDVKEVVPELVRENEDGMLSMRHQGITPILLEAIKELKAEIEELKKQIK